MNYVAKKIIAIIIIVAVVALLYFGAYLPLKKGQLYIGALKEMSSKQAKSVKDLNDIFRKVFDFYSPVGQNEALSAYLGVMLNVISQQDNKAVVDAIIGDVEKNVAPVLEAPEKAFNYWQSVYTMGLIYRVAAIKFYDENYYQKALQTFKEGLEYSPNRPNLLYGLLDLYVARGDKEKAKEIGQIILKYWPKDNEVRRVISY